jgi:TonB family protein
MTSRKLLAGLFVLLAGLGRYSLAGDEQAPDPQQLLDAVHKAADLSALGPFVLTARVVVNPGDGKREQTGKLTISRDHDLSRTELEIAGTDQVQIDRDHKSYIVPGQALLAASGLIGLDRTWDPLAGKEPEFATTYKLGKAHAETIGKNRAWCFDEKTEYMKFTSTEKFCVDAAQPVLLRAGFGARSRKEFMDYARANGQAYPQKISIVRERMAPVEVTNIQIAPATLAQDLFQPPQNTIEVESCPNMRHPEPKSTPEPSFPKRANAEQKQGEVLLDVIIAKDGTVALARSLTPDEYGFSDNAEATVRTWKFKPATCEGRPVTTEMNVEVSFSRF